MSTRSFIARQIDDNSYRATPADIAEKFGVSVRAARQLFHTEGFPALYIGNKYFCVESSFVKWCEEQKNDS